MRLSWAGLTLPSSGPACGGPLKSNVSALPLVRSLALFESQRRRSVAAGRAVRVCGVGHPVVPSVKAVTHIDAFGFMGSHGRRVGNRACFVKEASRRRLNVLESSRAGHSLEFFAPLNALAKLCNTNNSFKAKQCRSPSCKVAGIEAMFQLNQRANPSIERTSKVWPRCAGSSILASRGQPSAAAHVTR